MAFDALLEKCDLPSCGLGLDFTIEKRKDDLELPGDNMARSFKVSTLCYADDLVLLSEDPNSLSKALNKLKEIGEPLGIRVNVLKTKTQWLSRGPNSDVHKTVNLGDEVIENVSSFLYLGSLFSEPQHGGVVRPDILANVQKARSVLDGLGPVFALKGLGVRVKEKLVKSLVLPKLYYSAETWACTEKELAPLKALLSRARRLIFRNGVLGASTWRFSRAGPLMSRVLPCSARKSVAIRRLTFAIQLAAGGACKIAKDLLCSRVSVNRGTRIGGRCRSHYLRALVADQQWITGKRDPKTLSALIGEAKDHYDLLSSGEATADLPSSYPIDAVFRNWQKTLTASGLGKFVRKRLRKICYDGQRKQMGVTPSLVSKRPQISQCLDPDCFLKFARRAEMLKHRRNMHTGTHLDQHEYRCSGPNCTASFKRELLHP